MRRIASRLASAGLCLLAACAKQAPPPGGPEDRTPPDVAGVDPPAGSAGVSIHQPVRISFSKSMRRADVEQAIHFFPAPSAPPRFDWDGRDLIITPEEPWDSGQTYVLMVPPEATDSRGNRLAATFQAAFSTGSRIDSGCIVGQVLAGPRPAEGAWVLCYRQPAQSDPEVDTADYVVQADDKGRFTLSFLSRGSYRVFALADRDRDWLWNIGEEDLAVPSSDLEVDAPETFFLPALHLADRDTSLPSLAQCRPLAPNWWALAFDRDLPGFWADSCDVFLTRGADTQDCDLVLQPAPAPAELWAHTTADGPADEVVVRHRRPGRLSEACVPDQRAGDSLGFALMAVLPDTSGRWSCPPPAVSLWFNRPVATSAAGAFYCAQIPLSTELRNPFELAVTADWGAALAEAPQLAVAPGAVRSQDGGEWPQADTARFSLPLAPADSTGDYEISLHGLPTSPEAVVFLEVWPVSYPDQKCRLEVRSGDGILGRLAGGDYLLALLRDQDGDQVWSAGWPDPFVPSERLWYPADTLRVRPRFTTEFVLNLVP